MNRLAVQRVRYMGNSCNVSNLTVSGHVICTDTANCAEHGGIALQSATVHLIEQLHIVISIH
jgi:hypothetical protein